MLVVIADASRMPAGRPFFIHRSHAPAWERTSAAPAVRIGTLEHPFSIPTLERGNETKRLKYLKGLSCKAFTATRCFMISAELKQVSAGDK